MLKGFTTDQELIEYKKMRDPKKNNGDEVLCKIGIISSNDQS